MLIVGVLVSAALVAALIDGSSSTLPPDERPERGGVAPGLPAVPPAGTVPRLRYPYSVVDGGVHSVDDARRAMDEDRVVAAHYARLDLTRARLVTVDRPQRVHVSYRIGDRIYWTGRAVQLYAGEQIITDGTVLIRARCGNCISTAPQAPVSPAEPPPSEFDRVLDVPLDPPLVAAPTPPDAPQAFVPPLAVMSGAPLAPLGAPFFDPVAPPGPGGGLPSGGGSGQRVIPPLGVLPRDAGAFDPWDGSTPPGGVIPPETGLAPGGGFPPGGGEPPAVVPEPATLWLLGSGLAAHLWRRRRTRNQSPQRYPQNQAAEPSFRSVDPRRRHQPG